MGGLYFPATSNCAPRRHGGSIERLMKNGDEGAWNTNLGDRIISTITLIAAPREEREQQTIRATRTPRNLKLPS